MTPPGAPTARLAGYANRGQARRVGTLHKMSRKYMPLCVAKFQFCYNNRENADIFGTAIEGC
jgi:hypothetical protein